MDLSEKRISELKNLYESIKIIHQGWADLNFDTENPNYLDEDDLNELEMYFLQNIHDVLGKIFNNEEGDMDNDIRHS